MRIIGLTGGMGSGKSTVSNYLRDKGFIIIDADAISHAATEGPSPTMTEIAKTFGKQFVDKNGALKRKMIAEYVFGNEERKAKLERIIFGEVFRRTDEIINELLAVGFDGVVFIDAPLLFESGLDGKTDEVWTIIADEDVRVARVMERDNLTEAAVRLRIAGQMSDEEKASLSTHVIDNSGTLEELLEQVDELLNEYVG